MCTSEKICSLTLLCLKVFRNCKSVCDKCPWPKMQIRPFPLVFSYSRSDLSRTELKWLKRPEPVCREQSGCCRWSFSSLCAATIELCALLARHHIKLESRQRSAETLSLCYLLQKWPWCNDMCENSYFRIHISIQWVLKKKSDVFYSHFHTIIIALVGDFHHQLVKKEL